MDKRFVQAHKEARWALWLTLLYLAAWLAAAYLTEPYTADRVAAAVGPAVSSALFLLCLWLVLTTGSGLFLLLGALWLTYRSLPPELFLARRLVKPSKSR